jgi:hypothetical protein
MASQYMQNSQFDDQPLTPDTTENTPHADNSLWWVISIIGAAVALVGTFVFFETLQIFVDGTSAWFSCVQGGDSNAFVTCGSQINLAYEYRFGLDALPALGLSIVTLFLGPIPLIIALNRYKNELVAGILFFVVVIPYGTLAFLVMMIGVMVALFYTMQLVI